MRAIPPDAAGHPFPAPVLPELDRECGACQGNGIVTSPEWLAWHDREKAAKAAWYATHDEAESWWASPEGRAVEGEQPEVAEINCGACQGSGYTLTDAGRDLLRFLQRHPPNLTRTR